MPVSSGAGVTLEPADEIWQQAGGMGAREEAAASGRRAPGSQLRPAFPRGPGWVGDGLEIPTFFLDALWPAVQGWSVEVGEVG